MAKKKWKVYCHDCQLKRGAVEPKHGLAGTTCSFGFCDGCETQQMIQPSSDYDWPKEGVKAIWD